MGVAYSSTKVLLTDFALQSPRAASPPSSSFTSSPSSSTASNTDSAFIRPQRGVRENCHATRLSGCDMCSRRTSEHKDLFAKGLAAQCRNTLKKNVFHLFVNGDSSRTATSGRMQHKAPPRLENIASDVVKFLVKQRHDETVANFGLRFRGAAGNAATCIHILAWRVPPPPAQPPRAAGASGQHTWGSGPSF